MCPCFLDIFWGKVFFSNAGKYLIFFVILEKIAFQWLETQKQMLILWPLSKQGKIFLEKVKTFLSVDNVKYIVTVYIFTKVYCIFLKVYKLY